MQRLQSSGSGAHMASCMSTRLPLTASSYRPSVRGSGRPQLFDSRRTLGLVRALEWPDQELIDQAAEEFPEAGVASVEQARALFSNLGYVYLDVRPALELEEVGKVRGCINIPIVHARRVWNSQEGKKALTKEENPDFVRQVELAFPDKEEARLLIACSNGKNYSMDALMALEEAGYSNLVGLRGGYYAWNRKFDNKLQRRRFGEYQEEYTHGGDSAGIHGSGAGFENQDKIEPWIPPDY